MSQYPKIILPDISKERLHKYFKQLLCPCFFSWPFQRTWLRSWFTKPLRRFSFWTIRSLTSTKAIAHEFKVQLVRQSGPLIDGHWNPSHLWNKADISRETCKCAQGEKGLGLDSRWKLLEDFPRHQWAVDWNVAIYKAKVGVKPLELLISFTRK